MYPAPSPPWSSRSRHEGEDRAELGGREQLVATAIDCENLRLGRRIWRIDTRARDFHGSDGPRIHCGDEWGLHGGFAFRKVDCVSVLLLWMSGKTTTVYGYSSSKPEKWLPTKLYLICFPLETR